MGAALACICFGITLGFWLYTKQSLLTCVLGSPECSSAAATWSLLIATACAFIAAYDAASKAGKALRVAQDTLNVEKEPILGQWICTEEQAHKVPRESVFIENRECAIGRPQSLPESAFIPINFDFENLGRIALLNVRVRLHLEWADEGKQTEYKDAAIQLGSIGAHGSAHVSVYLVWDAPVRPRIGWLPEATVQVKSESNPQAFVPAPLMFSPFPLIEVEGDIAGPPGTSTPTHTPTEQNPPSGARWLINYVDTTPTKQREATTSRKRVAEKKIADPSRVPEEQAVE